MYSAQVLDHFQSPRNAGQVQNPDARVQMENPACGDILELTARIAAGQIAEIRFRAKGCVSAMACGSALTEMVTGMSLDEAQRLRREEMLAGKGGGPPAALPAGALWG